MFWVNFPLFYYQENSNDVALYVHWSAFEQQTYLSLPDTFHAVQEIQRLEALTFLVWIYSLFDDVYEVKLFCLPPHS
jgi:hypothetical protein